jgi:hypothetical protein
MMISAFEPKMMVTTSMNGWQQHNEYQQMLSRLVPHPVALRAIKTVSSDQSFEDIQLTSISDLKS